MKIKLPAIILLFLPLFSCFAQEIKMQNSNEKSAEVFIGLRNQVFSASSKSTGIKIASAAEPWGIVMETGLPEGVVTLVSLKDGTASLYFGHGGGIIGGGSHKSVSDVAKNFVTFSSGFLSLMNKTAEFPLPVKGKVRFYILTDSGIFASAFINDNELGEGRDKLSKLFYSGHEVITALQKIDEN